MGTAIAVDGDVSASEGSTPFPPAASGSWSAGPVSCVAHAKLKISGTNIIHQASCTFTFNGQTSSSPPVTVVGTEVVVLSAAKTTLSSTGLNVLLDGDSAQGVYGNKLEVSASNTNFKTS